MKRILPLLSLFCLTACFSSLTVYKLINQKEKYYWTGEVATDTYDLFVDNNTERIWFDARLIKNNTDTFYLNGFEKGNDHPSGVRTVLTDSIGHSFLGHIFIWTYGRNADSVKVESSSDSIHLIPINFTLYKRPKFAE